MKTDNNIKYEYVLLDILLGLRDEMDDGYIMEGGLLFFIYFAGDAKFHDMNKAVALKNRCYFYLKTSKYKFVNGIERVEHVINQLEVSLDLDGEW